ncbi:MAG TPA: DUF481 domain-containing protein [Gemmatimonadaceae bacterium]|nr:DUF481 domain-containing protein [Gemmatimonadaceae bacterium]
MLRPTLVAVALLAAAGVAGAQTAKPTTSFTGDLGYVSASGNTRLSTMNLGDKLVHTSGLWTFTQTAAYVQGETKGVQTANQFLIAGRADYAFQPRLSLFAGASYERNPFAGFNRRTNELLGVRWKAVEAPSDSLAVDAGGALTQQTDVNDSTENYPAARLAASYKHSFSKAAYFQENVEYLPDLKTSGAYRMNSTSALVAPISAHIGIKVSYAVQYNSRPPENFGTTDRLLTTGVQVTF